MTACALRYSRIRFRSSTVLALSFLIVFFFNDTATTEIYTLSLHDALPISRRSRAPSDGRRRVQCRSRGRRPIVRVASPSTRLRRPRRARSRFAPPEGDRKSTRLNSSHSQISYAVFCLKKKKKPRIIHITRSQ